MTPHLQVETQNGKTRIKIVELPDKKDFEYELPFAKARKKALSKGIEVHPPSILLAYVLISRIIYKDSARLMVWPDPLPDGLYPVSVRVKEKKKHCQHKGIHNSTCIYTEYAILE